MEHAYIRLGYIEDSDVCTFSRLKRADLIIEPERLGGISVAISIERSTGMRVGSRWRTCCMRMQALICSTMSTL